MDSVSIYYKNMADAMTYDGNMLFGHDRRNYIPLKIDLSARGQWLPKDSKNRDSRDKRLYAHEVCVPDDYMIVDAETYIPTSTYEEARIIRVNKRMFGTLNFTEYCEFSVRSDEKYHAVLEEAQRIHSVAWYISMITDEYISLDEELQELEKQREFDGNLYTFN